MSCPDLHGARAAELASLMSAVVLGGGGWRTVSDHLLAAYEVAGIGLSVSYQDRRVALAGTRWMVAFGGSERRPRPHASAAWSETAHIAGLPVACLHTPLVLHPAAFRHDMTKLRLFETEWTA